MAANQFKQWIVASTSGVDGLQFSTTSMPKIGLDDVRVEFRPVSLNYRSLIILNVSTSPVHCGRTQ
jgi:hypothetical protein